VGVRGPRERPIVARTLEGEAARPPRAERRETELGHEGAEDVARLLSVIEERLADPARLSQ
jgi:hypothetical protein